MCRYGGQRVTSDVSSCLAPIYLFVCLFLRWDLLLFAAAYAALADAALAAHQLLEILLFLPPISLQECQDYRCMLPDPVYKGTEI